ATRPHVGFLDLFAVHAAVDPHLHADRAVGRAGDGIAVADVGLQRRQRHRAGGRLLLAGDFRPAETAADADADTLGPGLHRRIHPLLEHAAEAGALLELLGDGLGDELAVEVRVLDLDDLHGRDFALDQVLDL